METVSRYSEKALSSVCPGPSVHQLTINYSSGKFNEFSHVVSGKQKIAIFDWSVFFLAAYLPEEKREKK